MYTASEKLAIITLVGEYEPTFRGRLREIKMNRSSFYRGMQRMHNAALMALRTWAELPDVNGARFLIQFAP